MKSSSLGEGPRFVELSADDAKKDLQKAYFMAASRARQVLGVVEKF